MSRTFFALALLSSLAGCAGHPAEDTDVITYGDPLPPALDEGEDDTDATNTDTDADGLSDDVEIALGTDPYDADSDDDGLSDGEEVAAGSDPLDPTSGDDGTNDVQVGEPDDTGDTGAPPEDDWVCGTGCQTSPGPSSDREKGPRRGWGLLPALRVREAGTVRPAT